MGVINKVLDLVEVSFVRRFEVGTFYGGLTLSGRFRMRFGNGS